MEHVISDLVRGFENGQLTRRQLIQGLALVAGAAVGSTATAAEPSSIHPVSVNHIALTVSDLPRSRDWYRNLFNLETWRDEKNVAYLGFSDTMLVLRPAKAGEGPRVSHFMFGTDGFNAVAIEAELRKHGLEPRKDLESFHVTDPDGLDVQVGDRNLEMPTSARK